MWHSSSNKPNSLSIVSSHGKLRNKQLFLNYLLKLNVELWNLLSMNYGHGVDSHLSALLHCTSQCCCTLTIERPHPLHIAADTADVSWMNKTYQNWLPLCSCTLSLELFLPLVCPLNHKLRISSPKPLVEIDFNFIPVSWDFETTFTLQLEREY